MRLTKGRLWQIGGAAAVAVYGLSGGCYAERLPPSLNSAERVSAREVLPYDVTVVPWDSAGTRWHGNQSPTAYATATYTWLRGSGAFSSVRLSARSDAPTGLVASSMGLYCNTAAVPILTIISVGVIPTVFKERDCDGVVFRAAGSSRSADSVTVRHDLERTVVMGWLAVPLSLLPGWTRGSALQHPRARDGVRLAILAHRAELAGLVSR